MLVTCVMFSDSDGGIEMYFLNMFHRGSELTFAVIELKNVFQ
jgi:hypothetical protein